MRSRNFSHLEKEDNEQPTFARIRRQKASFDDEEQQSVARKRHQRRSTEEVFKCKHCRRFVALPSSGGRHRNHCPYCLYSRHVDGQRSGDRLSTCGASMEPIGYFQRPNGEYVIVHQCAGCDLERFNRIASDDDFALVLALPAVTPRTSREMKLKRLSVLAEEWQQEEWQVEETQEESLIVNGDEITGSYDGALPGM